jgi:hypothetical protein
MTTNTPAMPALPESLALVAQFHGDWHESIHLAAQPPAVSKPTADHCPRCNGSGESQMSADRFAEKGGANE